MKNLCVASLFIGMAGHAEAASFDCAAARTPREKLICATPSLSAADDRMATLYHQAMEPLSEHGRSAIRSGQRSWLKFVDDLCERSSSAGKPAQPDTESCLETQYAERIRELENATIKKGPFLFVRVDHYQAFPESEEPGSSAILHSSYPQIDKPVTNATLEWNKLNERPVSQLNGPEEGAECDTYHDYSINLVTDDLINVVWDDSFYCHGTPHGSNREAAETFVLTPSPHLAQANDLFQPGSNWLQILTERTTEEIADGLDKNGLKLLDRPALYAALSNPARWRLTADGISVIFEQYELNLGYSFVPDITIGWQELRPALLPGLKVPQGIKAPVRL